MAANVEIDFEVFIRGTSEAIGAVRAIHDDHLVVWVENHGDMKIDGSHVVEVHDGKIVLDPAGMDVELLEAIGHAHDAESRSLRSGVSSE